jgi:hypothetical protein
MKDAREIWRSKTDEQVLEAFKTLHDYTDEGQEIIRGELSRCELTPGAVPLVEETHIVMCPTHHPRSGPKQSRPSCHHV